MWKTLIFSIAVIMVLVLDADFVWAAITIENPLAADTILELINGLIGMIWILAIPISTIMAIWSGWLFLTSGGDPAKVKQAKEVLLYTVIGVAIIIISIGAEQLIRNIIETAAAAY